MSLKEIEARVNSLTGAEKAELLWAYVDAHPDEIEEAIKENEQA